ncbi:hypothetical protein [Comamonas sp. JNW]|uniref:hypothetical protein n=1 Tax=unclassified Comamonas TaxID=2638500 RepID=UPI00105808F6|nr:hypothetical protein [Comamonas sp. JNW]
MTKTKAQREALYACPSANTQAIPWMPLVFPVVFMELSSFHASVLVEATMAHAAAEVVFARRNAETARHELPNVTNLSHHRAAQPDKKAARHGILAAWSAWPAEADGQ